MHYLIPKPAESGLSENNHRKMLFRELRNGGKSLGRQVEDFVLVHKTEVVFQAERRRPALQCGCLASSQWETCSEMTGKHFLTISNIPFCMQPAKLYVWPFLVLTMWIWHTSTHWTLHRFIFFFPHIQWWTSDCSSTAWLLSLDGDRQTTEYCIEK